MKVAIGCSHGWEEFGVGRRAIQIMARVTREAEEVESEPFVVREGSEAMLL
jgi:hypothetical protein